MAKQKNYDCLKLENQVCFPLYAAAKEVIKQYKPFLDELDLTYTQYITMMVMWEHRQMSVKKLGEYVYLDSGTLTPVLKKLEQKGYVERKRSVEDERTLVITITDKGDALRDRAVSVPENLLKCIKVDEKDCRKLYDMLYQLLDSLRGHTDKR